jgi:hypothetical protein
MKNKNNNSKGFLFADIRVENTILDWYPPMLKLEISSLIFINVKVKNICIHQCHDCEYPWYSQTLKLEMLTLELEITLNLNIH